MFCVSISYKKKNLVCCTVKKSHVVPMDRMNFEQTRTNLSKNGVGSLLFQALQLTQNFASNYFRKIKLQYCFFPPVKDV